MKLSISNIAWSADQDEKVYGMMQQLGFTGLEIAPTRIFPEKPYEDLTKASHWAKKLKADFDFEVQSMQSIWYERSEVIFGEASERQILLDYTKKAIDFAAATGCKNLVFGCPKSRNVPEGMTEEQANEIAVPFFKDLGDYAFSKGTVLALEPNPPIYNTNYMNTTAEALEFIRLVDSKGFLLNLDVGTMIENGESVSLLTENIYLINHVHISEPGLKLVQERDLHRELITLLKAGGYDRFVSVEMGKREDVGEVEAVMEYVRRIV